MDQWRSRTTLDHRGEVIHLVCRMVASTLDRKKSGLIPLLLLLESVWRSMNESGTDRIASIDRDGGGFGGGGSGIYIQVGRYGSCWRPLLMDRSVVCSFLFEWAALDMDGAFSSNFCLSPPFL